MPGDLESIWTYVDPSTMQGVTAGVVAACLAALLVLLLTNAMRIGLAAELEESLKQLTMQHQVRRRTSFLRAGMRIDFVHEEGRVSLRLGYKQGRIRGRLQCRRGGGLFKATVVFDEASGGLVEWVQEELGRASLGQ